MRIFFAIAIAAIFCFNVNSSYAKSNFSAPPDSVKLKKLDSPAPESFKFYKPKDMLAPVNTFLFDVPERAAVSMKVYDYDNKFVMELFNEELEAGTYSFNPAYLHYETSGMYKIVMSSGNFSDSKKIPIVK